MNNLSKKRLTTELKLTTIDNLHGKFSIYLMNCKIKQADITHIKYASFVESEINYMSSTHLKGCLVCSLLFL